MGDVVEFRCHGAPETEEEIQEHLDDTEQHAVMRNLIDWANSGQIFRVREIHELTSMLLARRGELE